MGNVIDEQATTSVDSSQNSTETAAEAQSTTAIDWSKIDPATIPVDVVKATPHAKEILNETVERRKIIKDLKKQLTSATDDGAIVKPDPATPTEVPADDVPAWAKTILAKVEAIEQVSTKAQRDADLATALKAHGLPETAAQFITGQTKAEIEAAAKALVTIMVPSKMEGQAGYGGNEDAVAKASRILASRLNKQTAVDEAGTFFSPQLHKNK